MAFYTRSQFAEKASRKAGPRGLRGYVNETRTFSRTTAVTSVFLSHSHHDLSVVEQAKIFFEDLGVSIYVDWADETMPQNTCGTTAQKIKNQIIRQNDKFVLLATNEAVASKWCNWEVGIADHFKLPKEKIAILPLADNRNTWNGNEYLQIYPAIEHLSGSDRNTWGAFIPEGDYVLYPPNERGDRTYKLLSEWLKR